MAGSPLRLTRAEWRCYDLIEEFGKHPTFANFARLYYFDPGLAITGEGLRINATELYICAIILLTKHHPELLLWAFLNVGFQDLQGQRLERVGRNE